MGRRSSEERVSALRVRWILPTTGLVLGVALVVLGALVIYHGSTVGIGREIETGYIVLAPPDNEAIAAGALMMAIGSITTSVSSALVIVSRIRDQIDPVTSSKGE
jgi:hypothetical protein